MNDARTSLFALFATCWKDEALKDRFLREPRKVLEDHGLEVPEGIEIKVVENTDDCIHVTLPAAPEDSRNLSDAELAGAAGGCGACGVSALPWSG